MLGRHTRCVPTLIFKRFSDGGRNARSYRQTSLMLKIDEKPVKLCAPCLCSFSCNLTSNRTWRTNRRDSEYIALGAKQRLGCCRRRCFSAQMCVTLYVRVYDLFCTLSEARLGATAVERVCVFGLILNEFARDEKCRKQDTKRQIRASHCCTRMSN